MFSYPHFYIYHGESGFAVLLTLRENASYPKGCENDLFFDIAWHRNTASTTVLQKYFKWGTDICTSMGSLYNLVAEYASYLQK